MLKIVFGLVRVHSIKSSQNASKAFLLKELFHCTHRAKKVPLFSQMF